MKKALLIGAVVSSMALSSVSFAAVDYQTASPWLEGTDFNYNKTTGVLTLVGDKTNANATTDTTIVVVADEKPATIDQSNIMYIDQAASAATYGDMGLLLPATIADGAKATVLFNDGTAAIYTATFDLKEAAVTPPAQVTKKIVFGDVTDGEYTGEATTDMSTVTGTDAAAILAAIVSGGKKDQGGYVDIGTVLEVVVPAAN
ncbi:MAG: hypothetical protein IKV86_05955 [Clostridia bacterium]|nr:hypothetical protein [Clostridia bacterium]